MEADPEIAARVAGVDAALAAWRQGDCVLGEHWFVHRFAPSLPVTEAGKGAAAEGGGEVDLAQQPVAGLVVVTQTCDVVRTCDERPYVEVCPLVEVEADRLREVERGLRPRYGFLPLLAQRNLVADLDRVMTVEKPVVANWERTPGWVTDAESRAFALALARKRARFAFPDDFNQLVSKLSKHIKGKHDRESDEGRTLRGLREIRVQATPSWEADVCQVFFWFVLDDEALETEDRNRGETCERWLKLVPSSGRFTVTGQITTLEDLTAAEYVDSDPLDLDHLSSRDVAPRPEPSTQPG